MSLEKYAHMRTESTHIDIRKYKDFVSGSAWFLMKCKKIIKTISDVGSTNSDYGKYTCISKEVQYSVFVGRKYVLVISRS